MSIESQRKYAKTMWSIKPYKLLKNPLCMVPIFLFIFIFSLYFTLQTALRENLPTGSFKFRSHDDNHKFEPIQFHGEKIVHLDFKGAPPKVHYLKEIFPIISKFGATALLIEYENTFPFEENLESLRSSVSYTKKEIEMINKYAKESSLKVIPLIETFSRLEYVLKFDKFKELRENEDFPTDICLSNKNALDVIEDIIKQILKVHPKSNMVHIGGDGIIFLGRCSRCKNLISKMNWNNKHIYLNHLKNVGEFIQNNFENKTILFWDDFLRKIDTKELLNFNLPNYFQPAILNSEESITNQINDHLLQKYTKIFHTIWFAGAFKGALNRNTYLTKSDHHITNIQAWLTIYRKYKDKLNINGMILMGRQRYDHFSILSDLLPVSIPSLTLTLTLLNGKNVPFYTLPDEINNVLNCQIPHAVVYLGNGRGYCSYPGGQLLDDILMFHKYKYSYEIFKNNPSILAWLSYYNVRNEMYNRKQVEYIISEVVKRRNELDGLLTHLKRDMNVIYQMETVDEWMESYIKPIYMDLLKLVDDAEKLMKKIVWE